MNASCKRLGDALWIYVDDILHLYIADRIISIQSWKEENSWWKIEIKTLNHSVLLEYDQYCKFIKILTLLTENT